MERHFKPLFSLIIAVIGADYALIVGGYSLLMAVAASFERRRHDGRQLSFSDLTYRKLLSTMSSKQEQTRVTGPKIRCLVSSLQFGRKLAARPLRLHVDIFRQAY